MHMGNALLFILLAPIVGGLVAGIDRKITARMQGTAMHGVPSG